MTIRWPCNSLVARDVSFNIASRSLAGPTSISGKTQVISSDAGIWKATFGNILIRGRTTRLVFRGLSTILEGRLTPILVPRCRGDQPVPAGAVDAGLYNQVTHDDDTLFDDDTGYVGGAIEVVSAGASAGAVAMYITVGNADDIVSGHDFSIGERLYRVYTYDADTQLLTFRPPLREAVAFGAALNFDDPVCRMRLATDAEMDLDLSMRRFGAPTVNFVEDV